MDSDGFFYQEIRKEVLTVQRENEADKDLYLLHDTRQASIDSIDHSFREKIKK